MVSHAFLLKDPEAAEKGVRRCCRSLNDGARSYELLNCVTHVINLLCVSDFKLSSDECKMLYYFSCT